MNIKVKYYCLLIVSLLILLTVFKEFQLPKAVYAQTGNTLPASASVNKNDTQKTVGWTSSFTGQTVTRTLVVTASDGKMKNASYFADPGSEWSGSYSGSSANFSGVQKNNSTGK
ncbi:MAG: hypothetical protein LBE12_09805 [Planctomycetaceae bacterium]|jgi:hypothetical protein|nr:hypothetical protein [Planctomycetaceae bacterium]